MRVKEKLIHYRYDLIALGIMLSLYLISRLISLGNLPIFTDEAIYLRWAQIAKNDSNWRFISLTDGKQPLFVWLMMLSMKFVTDPLIAGRLVSVGAGLLSLILIYILSLEIFHCRKIALFAGLLYLCYPNAILYDRMALMDGIFGTSFLLVLYLQVLLAKKIKLDLALLLGMAMGASMLIKSTGFMTIYLLPLSLAFVNFKNKFFKKNLSIWLFYAVLSIFISQLIYGVLRLSPFFHMIAQKDTTFIFPFKEWLTHPFLFFLGNLRGLFDWTTHYLTFPLSLVTLLVFFIKIKEKTLEKMFLFLWFLLPIVALALFGKVLYPRYIFFMSLPLLILTADALFQITLFLKNKIIQVIIFILLLLPSIYLDSQIIFDIKNAALTKIDLGQYVSDWPSGWGVKEANNIFLNEAQKGKISIYTDGTFGLLPYSVELYLVYNPNVYIKGIYPLPETFPKEMAKRALTEKVYFIANERKNLNPTWPLKLIGEWPKGNNQESTLRLYEINKVENL